MTNEQNQLEHTRCKKLEIPVFLHDDHALIILVITSTREKLCYDKITLDSV